jgi:hypothetical protein
MKQQLGKSSLTVYLFDILNWQEDDIVVEDRVSEDAANEFADYIISAGPRSILIEAKKAGANFERLPKGRKAFLRRQWMSRPWVIPLGRLVIRGGFLYSHQWLELGHLSYKPA